MKKLCRIVCASSIALLPGLLLAQGGLTPAEGPAPSMKTLQQIWDKIDGLEGTVANQEAQVAALQQMTAQQATDLQQQVLCLLTAMGKAPYLVVDLSGGTNALTYPVTYLAGVPSGGWSEEHRTTKLVLRLLPAGTFTMGGRSTDYPGASDDGLHQVTLSSDLYIGVFEVTQRQWELVVGNRPSHFTNATHYATRPVERVSYYDIRENPANSDINPNWPETNAVHAGSFMGKLRAKTGLSGFDLPTESQWEYACRAGTTTALNSGYDLTNTTSDARMAEVGRYQYNHPVGYSESESVSTNGGTAAAGSYLANAWGLYDMHGNVDEWCRDWSYAPNARVYRGGHWRSNATECRSAFNNGFYPPLVRVPGIGFRACCAP